MTFDLRTIYAMTALACLVLGLLQAVVFMSGRFDRWLAWWSASNLTLGLGDLFIGFRGYLSDVITVQLGNVLVIAGCAMMPVAMRMFAGRKVDFLRCGLLLFVLVLPMLIVFPTAETARERVIYGSLVSGLLDLAVAYEASRLAKDEGLYTARLTCGLFLTTGFIYALRAGFGMAGLFGTEGLFDGGSGSHAFLGLVVMAVLTLRGMLIVLMAAERAANQLREAAYHDPLTGVLNRSGLLNTLQNGPPDRMALLLVDLDHFKQLNDNGGHALGDTVLQTFASAAVNVSDRSDLVARHGGDEFVILLRHRNVDEAVATAERLRFAFAEAIAQIRADLPVRPTLSIGVAVEVADGETLEALLHRADHALYRVKRRGRDGIEVSVWDAEHSPVSTGVAGGANGAVSRHAADNTLVAAMPPVQSPAGA